MTESDKASGTDATEYDSVDEVSLTPAAEDEVRDLLASLPSPPMPATVRARLAESLAAESAARAQAAVVTPIRKPSERRNRWFVGAAGVAAVGVLGLVVGSAALTQTSEPPPVAAAVVPMSQSGTIYEKGGVAAQVANSLPNWRASNVDADSTNAASTEPVATPLPVTATPSLSSATPSDGSSPVVDRNIRDHVSKCIQQLDTRPAMFVDLAAYREKPQGPAEPVAVAVVANDGVNYDVYVLDMNCVGSINEFLREHVTVAMAAR